MRGTMSMLPGYLGELQVIVEDKAREAGLDFFSVIFEILSFDQMNEIAAFGGFPARYPHWRFGMEYNRLSKSSTYGLHRIYEMVINNDPCYAYLLEGNSLVEQKMVMAHVLAHCDFFKNNLFFDGTNRKMMDEMANHRTKVSSIMDKVGVETTEWFIDACLSIENLIDVSMGPSKHLKEDKEERYFGRDEETEESRKEGRRRKEYMEPFMKKQAAGEKPRPAGEEPEVETLSGVLSSPTRDVMGFLLNHAPLKTWEQNILEIARNEAYYFAPQGQTKIMNEGWATYWHSKLMTEKLLDASEVVDYADRASAITASSGPMLNPYKLGVELLRDIEERWDKGRFGKDWEECEDAAVRRVWDTGTGLGKQKLFEVRRVYNDIMFIDEFLTEEFCRENRLFTFGFNEKNRRYEIESKQFQKIKMHLLLSLTNLGNPIIEVEDANYENKGQLKLRHCHEGIDLRLDWAQDTLANIFKIWKRPVLIATILGDSPTLLKFDGKEQTQIVAG
jgi:stage V sporulation protein R